MRVLIRYRFTKKSELISGTETNGRVTGVYRDAESIEEGFAEERAMWNCWGADIEFVEGKVIRC